MIAMANSKGVLLNDRTETDKGLEATFATNTLGVYHLTELLMPKLQASGRGRVVNVSSGGMYNVKLSSADLECKAQKYAGEIVYAQTKRAEVELAKYWAAKYPDVRFHSMHPG
jgi:dehydrogenase/reductase SDR family protein 12